MCLGNRLEDFPEKAYSSRQLPFNLYTDDDGCTVETCLEIKKSRIVF